MVEVAVEAAIGPSERKSVGKGLVGEGCAGTATGLAADSSAFDLETPEDSDANGACVTVVLRALAGSAAISILPSAPRLALTVLFALG